MSGSPEEKVDPKLLEVLVCPLTEDDARVRCGGK